MGGDLYTKRREGGRGPRVQQSGYEMRVWKEKMGLLDPELRYWYLLLEYRSNHKASRRSPHILASWHVQVPMLVSCFVFSFSYSYYYPCLLLVSSQLEITTKWE